MPLQRGSPMTYWQLAAILGSIAATAGAAWFVFGVVSALARLSHEDRD